MAMKVGTDLVPKLWMEGILRQTTNRMLKACTWKNTALAAIGTAGVASVVLCPGIQAPLLQVLMLLTRLSFTLAHLIITGAALGTAGLGLALKSFFSTGSQSKNQLVDQLKDVLKGTENPSQKKTDPELDKAWEESQSAPNPTNDHETFNQVWKEVQQPSNQEVDSKTFERVWKETQPTVEQQKYRTVTFNELIAIGNYLVGIERQIKHRLTREDLVAMLEEYQLDPKLLTYFTQYLQGARPKL